MQVSIDRQLRIFDLIYLMIEGADLTEEERKETASHYTLEIMKIFHHKFPEK